LPDIGAARLELQDVLAGAGAEAGGPAAGDEELLRTARRSRSRERWTWATALVVAAGLASLVTYGRLSKPPGPRAPAQFVLDTPDDLAFFTWSPVAVSPDGRHVAFIGSSPGGDQQLWLRPLDSTEARPLPGTVGALGGLFWSADSTEIAFAAEGELRKLALGTGTVLRVCEIPPGGFSAGTWSAEGTIVFASGSPSPRLYSVSGAGGEARPLTPPDESRGETGHWWPQFLPDGRHLLFVVAGTQEEQAGLHVISLEAPGERSRIRREVARFRYAPPGHLLFVQGGVLLAQRFDARRLVTRGEPVPIASSVATPAEGRRWGWFSASATGRLAWLSGQGSDLRLEWVDREGKRLGTLGEPGRYGQVALSPDDRQVAAEIAGADGPFDLWLIDVARGVPSRLTTDPANDRDPVWSPDSRSLVFSSNASGDQNLVRKGLEGSEPAAPLPGGIGQTPGEQDVAKDWIREGNTLLYLTIGDKRTLWALSLDGHGAPESLVEGFAIDQPHVSPDGRWLAYISQESRRYEAYVQPFRRRGERVRVSAKGGAQPRWRGDGKELFYLSLDGALMAVSLRDGRARLEVGMPNPLVAAEDLQAVVEGPDYNDYAVTADGQRFLVKRSVEEGKKQRIHVLLDWTSLVTR
jgi:Tol biopolymer transport system component